MVKETNPLVGVSVKRAFIAQVWRYYRNHGRHTLPWRLTTDPYRILVSEVMLQQTQVSRVLPKYVAFIERFPTVVALSQASLHDVLSLWQGLGYNRRAQLLWQAAIEISRSHDGVFPRTRELINSLPGVGTYTAGAIMAFAYNEGYPIVETNIRTVIIHHFFATESAVTEAQILAVVKDTLSRKRPREWYYALMDYGVYLKQTHGNLSRNSVSYKKQTPFKGSARQVRAAIVRALVNTKTAYTKKRIESLFPSTSAAVVGRQLESLVSLQMVECRNGTYRIASASQ